MALGEALIARRVQSDPASTLTFSSVYSFLMAQPDEPVLSFLETLRQVRPKVFDLLPGILSGSGRVRGADSQTSLRLSDGGERSWCTRSSGTEHQTLPPVVQFDASVFYVNEDEDCACLKFGVIRIGPLAAPSLVHFRTLECSAKKGVHFQEVEQEVRFEPDQDRVEMEVPIIDNDGWSTCSQFRMELHRAEGCILGAYLHRATVNVIDKGCFPTSKHATLLRAQQSGQISKYKLFWEYLRFNLQNPKVRSRTKRFVVVDQLHNLRDFVGLLLQAYTVDYVLKSTEEVRIRDQRLMLLCFAQVLALALLHCFDNCKNRKWLVAGTSMSQLQTGIIRKYLIFDTRTRLTISKADVLMAVRRDARCVAELGYLGALSIIKETGQLGFMLLYQMVQPWVFTHLFGVTDGAPGTGGISWHFLGLNLLGFFVGMIFIICCRYEKTAKLVDERQKWDNHLTRVTGEAVNNFRLISDFHQFEREVDQVSASVDSRVAANRDCLINDSNNLYCFQWLTLLVTVAYTLYGGMQVVNGELSLGLYQAQIALVGKIGGAYGNMYSSALQIYTSFPALQNVTRLLNGPTDLLHRKKLSDRRRKVTQELKSRMRLGPDKVAEDELHFCARDITFKYEKCSLCSAQTPQSIEVLLPGQLEQEQGTLGVLFGPQSGGKTTLCNIIGGFQLPNWDSVRCGANGKACFFTPAHIRAVSVSGPLFFYGTLLENMTFGVVNKKDSKLERVQAICTRVGLSEGIVEHLGETEMHNWTSVFSGAECLLLAVARALIANPNLLCLHRIIDVLADDSAARVLKALRKFIEERGLEKEDHLFERVRRRPRTVFLTVNNLNDTILAEADYAYKIDRCIERVHPAELVDAGACNSTELSRADA